MSAPPEVVTFLGRFHPVVVHLPIGLIVLLFIFELLGFSRRFRHVSTNAGLVLTLAVPLAVVTAVLGWLLSWSGGYDPRLLNWHKWSGVATAGITLVAALLYHLDLKKAYRLCISAAFGVLLVASHFGGSLTHGSDYLTQYAPKPLRQFVSGKRNVPIRSQAKASSSPQAWADVVHPILMDKCAGCHGPEKSKGGLRLDSIQAMLKGGEDGPAIIPGKAADSQMLKRLLLPTDKDEHMPPDGKPQPSEDEIALLRWWIDAGAPSTQTIAELKPPPAIANILAAKLNLKSSTANSRPFETAPKPIKEVMAVLEQLSNDIGTPVTLISAVEPWLQCNASLAGTNFGDNQLARLASAGANLRWLDLGGTAVSDAGLATLSRMPNLSRLHLEKTSVSDVGLAALTNAGALEYLNLYGTDVTDAGLAHLQKLPKLKHVYLWQTRVSPDGAKTLLEARSDKAQIQKWREEIEQLEAKIREQQVTVELGTATRTNEQAAMEPINTTCPVSGKAVQKDKTALYQNKLVGFCCDDCKAKFEKDPLPFLEKLGLSSAATQAR